MLRLQAKKYPNISNTLKRGLVEIVETCRDCQKCQTIKRGHRNNDTLQDANVENIMGVTNRYPHCH